MNESRSSYVKIMPLVFLTGLLVAGLWVFRDYQYDFKKPVTQLWYLDWLIAILKNTAIWLSIGLAFRQMKAAAIALGITLLLTLTDHFFYKFDVAKTSIVLSAVYTLLFNISFLPAMVFGFLCFNKQGLRYFVPMWLFASVTTIMFVGGFYLDASPYNVWYRFLRVDRLLRTSTGEHSYRVLQFLSYFFHIAVMPLTVIAVGECYAAATAGKKWKSLFHIDLSNNYTKPGAIALFYTLRLVINLLVIGMFTFPFAHFFESGRVYYRGQSWFSFILTMISGVALLAGIVLFYRRFMVEYFISHHRKIQWLFWLVNIPIAGLLVFPFVALNFGTAKPEEARTRFYFNNAMYNVQPYKIMGVMLGLSVISSWAGRSMGSYNDIYWLLWLVEITLFIWYVAAVTGYYVILGAAVIGSIIFFSKMAIELQAIKGMKNAYGVYGYRSPSGFFDHGMTLWYVAGFNVVQYVIFLPMFHLNEMKTVQSAYSEPEASMDPVAG
jgi:hypothetical protein